ncbi:MAG TPA: magnesium transporter CorA family protein [Actinomycetota bacterium]|nr:magnesium transporter CorA family protein [Actinomycetota bacterium]
MEARIVREGSPEPERIPLDTLRERLSALADGEWIWVDGVEPTEGELALLAEQLRLHELVVEDVHHRNQRAKVELYPEHAFAAFRPLSLGADGLLESELFLIVSDRCVTTLRFPPVFDVSGAERRWRMLASMAPGTGAAFYAVADEVADDYLEVVEALEDRADELEAEVFDSDPRARVGAPLQLDILQLRRDMVRLRRHAVPMRQAIDRFADDSRLVTPALVPYLRDISDHLLRTTELADGVRDVLTTIVDIRMAQSAHQLNEVMRKLTAWAGIILVPTLIAGIYGMNFDHMPELHWTLGYPLALGMMTASAAALYGWFRKRGWV